MAATVTVEFGVSKRGKRTLISSKFEYWRYKKNSKGETLWRCIKKEVFHCKATVKTNGDQLIGNVAPDHNHSGNASTSLARKAVGEMKKHMTNVLSTPSASQVELSLLQNDITGVG